MKFFDFINKKLDDLLNFFEENQNFLLIIFLITFGLWLYAESQREINSNGKEKVMDVTCNQFKKYGFFDKAKIYKICPNKYNIFAINVNKKQNSVAFIISPPTNKRIITKDDVKKRLSYLSEFYSEDKNLNSYLKKIRKIIEYVSIDNDHYSFYSKNINYRYNFQSVIVKNLPSDIIKDLYDEYDTKKIVESFAKFITNNDKFRLYSYNNKRVYRSSHSWIYVYNLGKYLANLENRLFCAFDYKKKILACEEVYDDSPLLKISYMNTVYKKLIKKYNLRIIKTVTDKNNFNIYFQKNLSRKDVENILDTIISNSNSSTSINL